MVVYVVIYSIHNDNPWEDDYRGISRIYDTREKAEYAIEHTTPKEGISYSIEEWSVE